MFINYVLILKKSKLQVTLIIPAKNNIEIGNICNLYIIFYVIISTISLNMAGLRRMKKNVQCYNL